jgi:hypothetical protein
LASITAEKIWFHFARKKQAQKTFVIGQAGKWPPKKSPHAIKILHFNKHA